MKLLLTLLFLSQWGVVNAGPSLPPVCHVGDVYITTVTPTLNSCNTANVWTSLLNLTPTVPSGLITLVTSSSCPFSYSEITALNGKMLFGTIAANNDVGNTGGSDSITPTGSNSSLTFTGSALAAHAHELPWQIPSTTTIRQIASTTFGTGTSRAATAVSAAGTANTTSAAVALSESKSAGTPAGTINTPIFTGTSFDNRSAYMKVIFCKKD